MLKPGDVGAVAVTKLGGLPWWPSQTARPKCERGHAMGFASQVRLADVPGVATNPGLLSFHYCETCALEGRMSFGRSDKEHRGYEVRLFATTEQRPDALGVIAESTIASSQVQFSDAIEIPGFEDLSAMNLELPEGFFDQGDDFEESFPGGFSHVARCKIGGWPSWQQSPDWPRCKTGHRMNLVLQIDFETAPDSAWGGGGYAFLFACGPECNRREADLVIQTS